MDVVEVQSLDLPAIEAVLTNPEAVEKLDPNLYLTLQERADLLKQQQTPQTDSKKPVDYVMMAQLFELPEQVYADLTPKLIEGDLVAADALKNLIKQHTSKSVVEEFYATLQPRELELINFIRSGGSADDYAKTIGPVDYVGLEFKSEDDPMREKVIKDKFMALGVDEGSASTLITSLKSDKKIVAMSDEHLKTEKANQLLKQKELIKAQEQRRREQEEEAKTSVNKYVSTILEQRASILKDGKLKGGNFVIPEPMRVEVANFLTNIKRSGEYLTTDALEFQKNFTQEDYLEFALFKKYMGGLQQYASTLAESYAARAIKDNAGNNRTPAKPNEQKTQSGASVFKGTYEEAIRFFNNK